MTNACAIYTSRTRLRVQWAPGASCSLLGGSIFLDNPDASRRGIAEMYVKIGAASLRAKRSNPSCRKGRMDCVASLAMTIYFPSSPANGSRECAPDDRLQPAIQSRPATDNRRVGKAKRAHQHRQMVGTALSAFAHPTICCGVLDTPLARSTTASYTSRVDALPGLRQACPKQ